MKELPPVVQYKPEDFHVGQTVYINNHDWPWWSRELPSQYGTVVDLYYSNENPDQIIGATVEFVSESSWLLGWVLGVRKITTSSIALWWLTPMPYQLEIFNKT